MSHPLAGNTALATQTDRVILFDQRLLLYGKGQTDKDACYDGKQASGFEYSLEPGTLMARITDSKLWCPVKRALANGAGVDTAALVVDEARFFKVGETVTDGTFTEIEITAIDYATNTLTLEAAQDWADNAQITCDSLPGSEYARAVLDEYVDHWDKDARTVRQMNIGKLLVSGCVKAAMVLGDLVAVRAASNGLSHVIFDDDIGQD